MTSGGTRKLCVYFFWGGYVQEEEDGKVSYQGGSRDCILVSESMSLDEVRGRLMRRVASASKDEKFWYTLKFDRKIFLPLDADDAVEAMFMGNEEHAYVYMDGHRGPLLRKKGDESEPGMGRVPPPHNGGRDDRPYGGSGERVLLVMPDEDTSEQGVDGMAVDCYERVDSVEKGSSAEREGQRARGGHVRKRLRFSLSKDDVAEDGKDLSAAGGNSSSSSSDESGMDEHANSQSDNHEGKLNLWKKEIVGVGQVFASAEAFRTSIFKYAIAHKFNYKFERNCRQRIVVKCAASGCPFKICVRGSLQRDMVVIRIFKGQHVHEAEDEVEQLSFGPGKRRLKASMLAKVIEGKIRGTPDYSPVNIMKDLESELGVKLTYTQSWRAREHVRMMVQGKPADQYKILPWMCEAICRDNLGSKAFCELEGSRFKRLFVTYAACLNGFKYCRPILFLGGSHLSGPCKGVLLTVCGLDADNRILNVAYAIVSAENDAEWLWFLEKVKDCLGELKPVVVSERHPEIIAGVTQVFGKECHAYCLRHLRENFLREASKHNLRKETTKHIVKEMFNRVAYSTNSADYDSEMQELRRYKAELADWIEANEPERWAASKFLMNRWGCMDTSVIDDWNKWMHNVRSLPIPCLVTAHLEKVMKKMEKNKRRVAAWVNGVGPKIEEILKGARPGMESVVAMQSTTTQVFTLSLSNWKRIVVDLGSMACTCNEWQMKGLPCAHAMVVIQKLNLCLYDFVYTWYKAPAQGMVYNEAVHPMKTHDMPGGYGLVEGGDNLGALLRNKVRPHERTPVRRRRSKSLHTKPFTCSKCREVGHNRRSCTGVGVNSDAGDAGDVVTLDELCGGQ